MRRAAFFALALMPGLVFAHGRPPLRVPVARLITNITAALKKAPKDPELLYLLGRVHYFASIAPMTKPKDYNAKSGELAVYGENAKIYFFDAFGEDDPGRNRGAGPYWYSRTEAQQVDHVRQAVTNLMTASQLAPSKTSYSYTGQPGLVELCLGCALEDGAKYAAKVGPCGTLKPSTDAWMEEALIHYKKAYAATVDKDLAQKSKMFGKLVSQEAGLSIKHILMSRRAINGVDEQLIAKIDKSNAIIEKFPRAITPIVLSLSPSASVSDLIQPTKNVRFDLTGTGATALTEWIRPEAGLLCWDPDQTGSIKSGMQLFGTSTWWMFWKDGYDALAALDDNRDGWLTGKELKGLSVWFDRNDNGVSDPGEVIPVEKLGIVALRTKWSSQGEHGFAQPNGVVFKNGTTLPTYDWVTQVAR